MLTTARKKGDAEAAAQSVVNYVVIWSQEWKLNLRADTSEVNPFSISSNDSTWTPNIFSDTQKVCVNTTPLLLGVILDRSLTFNFLYVEVAIWAICTNRHLEVQEVLHWLCECPALMTIRQREPSRIIRVACHSTWDVVVYARKTFVNLDT